LTPKKNDTLRIDTPRWAEPLLVDKARYRGAYGGRSSGKSWFFAGSMIEKHFIDPPKHSVCIREIQKDLRHSAKRLLEIQIEAMCLGHCFNPLKSEIKTPDNGLIIFQGMQNHTAESIKSLEGFDIAWIEEAHNLSQSSLDLLRPTLRKDDSEIWASWNPRFEDDPIDAFLRSENPPPDSVVVRANYRDNPWLPDSMRKELEYDQKRDPDKYAHIWLGDYQKHSEARVFRNWRKEDFDTPSDAIFRYGADWGFSIDPTVLVRCFVKGRNLFVDYEAYEVGCEIIDTPDLFRTVPGSDRWPIISDSARPETISHMKKHGFPKIYGAIKGAGSLEDGVEFLKTYDIIVHTRCPHVADEVSLYSYKIDKQTEKVLPILDDKHNHVIDALRYALEGERRLQKKVTTAKPIPTKSYF
jgi:phage terminase large subunit